MPQPIAKGPIRASHNVTGSSTLSNGVRPLPSGGSSGPRNTYGAPLSRSRLPSTSEAYGTTSATATRSASSARRISRTNSQNHLLQDTSPTSPTTANRSNGKVELYRHTVDTFGASMASPSYSNSNAYSPSHSTKNTTNSSSYSFTSTVGAANNRLPSQSNILSGGESSASRASYTSTYNSDYNNSPSYDNGTSSTTRRRSSTTQSFKGLSISGNNANSRGMENGNDYGGSSMLSNYSSNNGRRGSFGVSSKDGGLTGLTNLGNTCFMNSILQCMSNCKPLRDYCLSDDYLRDLNTKSKTKGELFRAFGELLHQLWRGSSSSVTPSEFKSQFQRVAPRFAGYSQQDAQEFLRYLLDGLHEDVNRVKVKPKLDPPNEEEENRMNDTEKSRLYMQRYLSRDNSIIVDLFMGQLQSVLTCDTCGNRSTTFDPFFDLSLPIPKRSSSVSIMDCLNAFFASEVLDSDEQPTCSKCKKKRKCSKAFRLQKFPEILVFHLKRFSGERYKTKVTTSVLFPLDDLNLSPYTSDTCGHSSPVYRLFAVSNHSGTVYSGHYTATCRQTRSSQWYDYNDSLVRQISDNAIVSSEAYVLFYEKR